MSVSRVTEWVQVAGKWTRMSRMGTYREHDVVPDLRFLMIPGNPGNERFYEHFGQTILQMLDGKKVEFLTVSHLNHVELPDRLKDSSDLRRDDLFKLADQVQHKLDFVREYVPKNSKLVIMGHSIGAYMGLSILDDVIADGFNVIKLLALFPTIEQMAVSPNGVRLGGVLSFFDDHQTISSMTVSWLWLVPDSVKRFLIGFNLKDPLTPPSVVESALEILSAPVIKNIVHMSNDELKVVVDHKPELFKHKDKIIAYYGQNDGWVPKQCPHQQLERLGADHVKIDTDNCKHDFVTQNGETMAKNVIKLLETHIN